MSPNDRARRLADDLCLYDITADYVADDWERNTFIPLVTAAIQDAVDDILGGRMTLNQLRSSFESARSSGRKTIALVIPGRANGNTKRLAGRSGPRGEVVCENENDCIVAFNVDRVLTWMDKNERLHR